MRLVKEPREEEVTVMSPIVYEAIKEDLEAIREEGRKEVEKIRREAEERREAAARVLLDSGVDETIICKATLYTLDELKDLQAPAVR